MANPVAAPYTVDWYRIPLPAGRLQELNERSDGRALIQAGGHCALMAMSGAAAVWAALSGHYWWLIPILLVHGTICAFMINAVHELVHGTVFRTRWLNTFFVHLFAFIGWINHRAFWASHSEHHTYTLHFPHDQENVLPIRFRFWDILVMSIFNWNAARYPLLATVRLSCGRLKGQWEEKLLAGQDRRFSIFSWSRWTLAGHVTIAAVSLYYGLWIIPVVVSLTPFYGQMLFFFLNSAQHVGMQPDVRDFRLNCRTIEVNPLFRFLYWNMNYHIEHHMYAAVPCYRLRALHLEIRHACPPVLNGLVATWYHIVSILWRQDAEPGYTYQPQIPGAPVPQQAPTVAVTQMAGVPARALATEARKVWQCAICGFIYDEVMGLPKDGIAPGTAWAAIPDSWRCPDCAIGKADFAMVEIQRPVAHVGPVNEPVVIIGSGMAAYTLARDIRRLDQTVPVTVLTQDAGDAYIKPLLSSALAHGRAAHELVQARASDLAKELNVTIRGATTVERIDRERRVVVTNHGEVAYGRLVLAVGSEPFRAALEGNAAQRVLSVNNLADYGVFRNQLRSGSSVAIVGGGLIGCEFANDLIAAGYQVRVIDRAAAPLSALVPTEVGHGLQRALTSAGVIWHAGMSLHAVNQQADGRLVLTVSDGSVYTADVVLSAIGLRPRLTLATTAGLATTRGIVVDRQLRTSDPAIFALGDCAEIDGQVLPFVAPLMHSARALAATLTGTPTAVVWPLLPITVKTPAFPVVVVSPGKAAGSWQVTSHEAGITARYRNAAGQVLGVIVAGSAVAQREVLCAEMVESTQAMALAG